MDHIPDAIWKRLSKGSRLLILVTLEIYFLQWEIQTVSAGFTKTLRRLPLGLAALHGLMAFAGLAISPSGAPPVWLAANYVLSLYFAALLWYWLSRRRNFAYG